MSEKRFEIAFSGKINDGADLAIVKQHIAKLFKADEKRLQTMFSGRRVIIKHSVDEITAAKYRGAFQKAGAICEVTAINNPPAVDQASTASTHTTAATQAPVTQPETTPAVAPGGAEAEQYVSRYPESDEIPQALMTEPLGVKGEEIEDLAADIAPVGSQLLDNTAVVDEPNIDISGLDVAPVGSTLSNQDQDVVPPPPDTSGITLAD